MKKRSTIVATTGLTAALAVAMAGPAWAFWGVGSTNAAGYAAVDALSTPSATTSEVTATNITFTVAAAAAGALKPTSYLVRRPGGSVTACSIDRSAAPGTAGSCSYGSAGSPPESGTYTVVGRLGTHWTSAATTVAVTVPSNDTTPPDVTINQATGQVDPTTASPITFTVQFSEPVTGFTSGDVALTGTAGATTAVVSGSDADYSVAVTGMTQDGTVIASIPAGAAADAAANSSTVSTSTDHTVTFDRAPGAPSTPDLVATSDTGSSSTDNLTGDSTPTFTGTADPGSTVVLLQGATQVGTGTANGSGMYSITTGVLTDGVYTLKARATDSNSSVDSPGTITVTIDTAGPALTLGAATQNGQSANFDLPGTRGVLAGDQTPVVTLTNSDGTAITDGSSFTYADLTPPNYQINLSLQTKARSYLVTVRQTEASTGNVTTRTLVVTRPA